MIVFDLKCAGAGHVFEAWFASSGAYDDQKARGLLMCPICGASDVSKAVMAPNVAAKSNRQAPVPMAKPELPSLEGAKAALAALAKAQAAALENSTWVGRDFDKQARAMDAGEVDQSSIHGEVSPGEAKALIEDGIGVMPLPLQFVPPNQRN
jgi:hypothetical protein